MSEYLALVWPQWLIVWVVILVSAGAVAGIWGLVVSLEPDAAGRAGRRFADLIAT